MGGENSDSKDIFDLNDLSSDSGEENATRAKLIKETGESHSI